MRLPRRKATEGNSEGQKPSNPPLPTFAPKTPPLADVGHAAPILKGTSARPSKPGGNRPSGKPGDRIVEWVEEGRRGVWNADGGTKCPYGVLVKITDFYRIVERK